MSKENSKIETAKKNGGTILSVVGAVSNVTGNILNNCLPGDNACESKKQVDLGKDLLDLNLFSRKKKS